MKKNSLIFVLLFMVLFLGVLGCSRKEKSLDSESQKELISPQSNSPSSEDKKEKKIRYYVDPMHPWYKSDKPGKAPDCGMDLVPVYEEGSSSENSTTQETGRSTVHLSAEKQQLIGVKTEPIKRRALSREIHATGRVAYHPDLLVAQSEYLVTLKTAHISGSEISGLQNSLVQAAKSKLRLLGMSETQIQELSKKGRPQMSLILPNSGDSVWIYGSIYESDLSWVKAGDTVQVFIPGSSEPHTTSIESIDPTIDPMTRTAQARFRISNSLGFLKPDMYLKLIIQAKEGEVLAIPNSAILSTGIRKIAFIDKGEGKFEPRNLKIGKRGSEYTEVLSGVSEGERVVTSANFLIDSESQLKAAIEDMGGHP